MRKIWLAITCLCILAPGFVLLRPTRSRSSPPATLTQIRATVPEVLILGDQGEVVASASAVFVSPSVLLTVGHVVRDTETGEPYEGLIILMPDGRRISVKTAYPTGAPLPEHPCHDTAVLVLDCDMDTGQVSIAQTDANLPALGESVVAIGWLAPPLGFGECSTFGHVISSDPNACGLPGYFVIDAVCGPGMSGGGVFDARTGRLIGLISRGAYGATIIEPLPEWRLIDGLEQ